MTTARDIVVRTMMAHPIRRVPVLDGHELVGIVAKADVARTLPTPRVGEVVEAVSTD